MPIDNPGSPGTWTNSNANNGQAGGGGGGWLSDMANGLSNAIGLGNIINGPPKLPVNPYQSQWDALLNQLRDQANGIGPSVAQQQYRQAQQQAMGSMISLSHGRGPGAARLATQGMTQIGEGETSGLALAKTQEMMAAKQAYEQALAAASSQAGAAQLAQFQANQNTPSGGKQLLGDAAQVAAIVAMMHGKPPPNVAGSGGPDGTGVGSNPTNMTGMTEGSPEGGLFTWAGQQQPQGVGMPGYPGTTPGYGATPYGRAQVDAGYFGGMPGY